jgi:hypothetical protein
MRSIEEAALVAMMDSDDDEARRLVAGMLPGEREALRDAALRLGALAAAYVAPAEKPD